MAKIARRYSFDPDILRLRLSKWNRLALLCQRPPKLDASTRLELARLAVEHLKTRAASVAPRPAAPKIVIKTPAPALRTMAAQLQSKWRRLA